MSFLRVLLLGSVVLMSGCDWLEFNALKLYLHFNQNLTIEDGVSYFESGNRIYSVSAAYEGLEFPWDVAFIDEATILVTEKPGRLSKIDLDSATATLISGVPEVSYKGQGGLLGVELHPDFSSNHMLYLSYTAQPEAGENQIHLLRAKLVGDSLENPEVLFRALPIVDGMSNLGGALLIDSNNYVYLSVGEHQSREKLQSKSSHLGTIVRLNDDGSIPSDNPFIGDPLAKHEIYSYGHRNPQGISIDPNTGTIWASEHGPKDGDELNIIRSGGNYGWPIVSYGSEYDDTPFSRTTDEFEVEDPVHYYTPAIAPAGLLFYSGNEYPEWKDHLLIGSLIGTHINLMGFVHGELVEKDRLLDDLTMRIRSVNLSPAGKLLILTENGIVLKIGSRT